MCPYGVVRAEARIRALHALRQRGVDLPIAALTGK